MSAFSAMSSLHIATALIVAGCVLVLARSLPVRLLARITIYRKERPS